MSESKVTVTKWSQGGCAPFLILDGTPEATREEARCYFDEDPENAPLQGEQTEMTEDELYALPEFES